MAGVILQGLFLKKKPTRFGIKTLIMALTIPNIVMGIIFGFSRLIPG
jgi:hypothetical protein